jgi:L-alanine-DL-glutamate epimerase-like enolase superfamily enzyme
VTTDEPVISGVRLQHLSVQSDPGDDTLMVVVDGAGHTGRYGPIAAAYTPFIRALAPRACGLKVSDHQALQRVLCDQVRHDYAVTPIPAGASWAIGAIDCAVWDLHGQLVGRPVAELLAPSPSPTVPVYASWLGLDVHQPAATEAVAQVAAQGWALTKWGLRAARPIDATALADAVQRVTGALGEPAAFDAVGTWNPRLAHDFAVLVNPRLLCWMEDLLPDHTDHGYRQLAERLPLGLGEQVRAGDDPGALLELKPRAFTFDVVGCGGLTAAIDLTQAGHAVGVPAYPHGRSFLPAIHLAAAFPEKVTAVEYRLQWEPRRSLLEPPEHGRLRLPTEPGLGPLPGRS